MVSAFRPAPRLRRPGASARRGVRSFRPRVEGLEDRLLLAVYTVRNTNDAGPDSLRQAILDANANPGADTIAFAIGGGGVQTIRPTSALPNVTSPVLIDGTTQPGYAGTPLIELTGVDAGPSASGLWITAGNSTVRALVVNSFGSDGIQLTGNGGNLIAGCHIGTDVTGTVPRGNGQDGITLTAANTVIGGTTPGAGNLIAGNGFAGISVGGVTPGGHRIQGNFIGTDVTGTQALGNGFGVYLDSNYRGTDVLIGGAAPEARNLISGNRVHGVHLSGSRHRVEGNTIGTDATGTRALGNGMAGVYVIGASGGTANVIGGPAAGAGNLISANGGTAVFITNSSDNVVQGNLIGTDVTGTRALGNGGGVTITFPAPFARNNLVAGNVIAGSTGAGVFISGGSSNRVQGNLIGTDITGSQALGNGTGVGITSASGNIIGGTAPGAGNLIAGNTGAGVSVGFQSSGNAIQGNLIGTDITGTRALGNRDGVTLASSNNMLGGSAVGAGNLISGNADYGVDVTGGGNAVQGNWIGLDLTGAAALRNTFGVFLRGSNNRVGGAAPGEANFISGNFAGVTFFTGGGNLLQGNFIGTDLSGTLAVGNRDGVVVLASAGALIGGTAPGAGNLISGNADNGLVIAAAAADVRVQGNRIGTDATGTGSLGNRNGVALEGSRNSIGGMEVGAGNLISGNRTYGLLVSGEGNVVQGNVVGADATGTRALGNTSGLSVSGTNHLIGGVVPGAGNLISGNTSIGLVVTGTGNRVQGNFIGTDVSGTQTLGNGSWGVSLSGSGNTLGGDGAGNLISGNASNGVTVQGQGHRVQGNFIGTDVTGTRTLGNGTGIRVSGLGHTIGGTESGAGNLISGNRFAGLDISLANNNTVQGNFIGTDVTGTKPVGNGLGLTIGAAMDNVIGGTVPGAGNVISGNAGDALRIDSPRNRVQGNRIGTDFSGTAPLSNGGHGVFLRTAGSNTIGGAEEAAGNLIAFNGGDGILVDRGLGNAIRRNAIFGHANGRGIRLLNGGNRNQAAPNLTSAVSGGGLITVEGILISAPNTTYTVELFANSVCHSSGFGEGERFFASLTVATNAKGRANFTLVVAIFVKPGQFVTATATDPAGNTSEFSACRQVTGSRSPAARGVPDYASFLSLAPVLSYAAVLPWGEDVASLATGRPAFGPRLVAGGVPAPVLHGAEREHQSSDCQAQVDVLSELFTAAGDSDWDWTHTA